MESQEAWGQDGQTGRPVGSETPREQENRQPAGLAWPGQWEGGGGEGKWGRGRAGDQKPAARPLAHEDQSGGPFPRGALTLFSTPRARRGISAKQPSSLLHCHPPQPPPSLNPFPPRDQASPSEVC